MSSYEFGVGYFWYKKRGLQVPWIYKKFKDRKYRSVSAATKHYFFAWIIVGSVNFFLMQLIIKLELPFITDTLVSVILVTAAMISMEFSIGLFFFRLRGKEVPWVYVKYYNRKFRSISGVDRSYLTGWIVLGFIHHFIFEGFFFIADTFILRV
ncbi:MAG: hypothetical protein INQ03_11465 [Candidatus Heimdallarchaeota archaeon]|nr:hypothetical protein [Candidatus Heimdallarchaeota archaeon]